jgi:hypothetical protein
LVQTLGGFAKEIGSNPYPTIWEQKTHLRTFRCYYQNQRMNFYEKEKNAGINSLPEGLIPTTRLVNKLLKKEKAAV